MFVPRKLLEQVGGFDDTFSMAGAGYANLDMYERLAATPGVRVATILGEGSFHQIHGGTTTNLSPVDDRKNRVSSYGTHYAELRGRPFLGPEQRDALRRVDEQGVAPHEAAPHDHQGVQEDGRHGPRRAARARRAAPRGAALDDDRRRLAERHVAPGHVARHAGPQAPDRPDGLPGAPVHRAAGLDRRDRHGHRRPRPLPGVHLRPARPRPGGVDRPEAVEAPARPRPHHLRRRPTDRRRRRRPGARPHRPGAPRPRDPRLPPGQGARR